MKYLTMRRNQKVEKSYYYESVIVAIVANQYDNGRESGI
jgi:hypothetical protein